MLWRKVAPGYVFTILDTVAEGDRVVVYWEVDVTYSVVTDPPPMTPMMPFGKPVKWRGMDIFTFADGKIVKMDSTNELHRMLVENGAYVLAQTEPLRAWEALGAILARDDAGRGEPDKIAPDATTKVFRTVFMPSTHRSAPSGR